MSIQTQTCVTLQFSNFAIAAVHFRVRICEYWHVSSWVYPSNWPLSTHWYWSTLSLSFAHTCVHAQPPPHTHTHNDAIIPLGMALSVAMVPLTAFSRSLVLSFAALTLPFSPATPAAFSTHTQHTQSKWWWWFDLKPRPPANEITSLTSLMGKSDWEKGIERQM